MSIPVAVTGAVMVCNKGTSIVPLVASGNASVKICDVFAAVVTDVTPDTNISPFGICAITKMVCSPAPVGNWLNPFANKCIIGNVQSLLEGATLPCAIGGTISVMSAAQATVLVGLNVIKLLALSQTDINKVDEYIDPKDWYERLDFDPGGKSQWELIAKYDFTGLPPLVRSLASEALVKAREQFGQRPEADSFRHAYWNYLMTQKIGADRAKEFGDAHERERGNTIGEHIMDLYNNSVGRQLAQDPGNKDRDPVQVIREALDSGKLRRRPFRVRGEVPTDSGHDGQY